MARLLLEIRTLTVRLLAATATRFSLMKANRKNAPDRAVIQRPFKTTLVRILRITVSPKAHPQTSKKFSNRP
ncbi:hypothetical protein [Burkholderia anthina]|uniref:hypothetical protein n=1 Tax=Burkholderia anthina TaxID=179879 RepID=UPI00158C460F|nr:hypothetical protein [Burkholderia anthina]